MQIWSISCYILEVSRCTNIVYIGRYLIVTYIETFFSTVCCFFSYIGWSVNCLNWVGKFHNFFLTYSQTEAKHDMINLFYYEYWTDKQKYLYVYLYLRALSNILYGKLISNSPILFKFKGLFQPLCQSVSCMSWVFES